MKHLTIPVDAVCFVVFLGSLWKLRKATISDVWSVRPSIRMEKPGSHWTDFNDIWYSSNFRKSVGKIQGLLKSDKNNGYFNEDRCTFVIYLTKCFLEWEMFQTNLVRKNENICSGNFSENNAVYEII